MSHIPVAQSSAAMPNVEGGTLTHRGQICLTEQEEKFWIKLVAAKQPDRLGVRLVVATPDSISAFSSHSV